MGCDIHLYQEKKVNGKWVTADKWRMEKDQGVESEYVTFEDRLWADRNYRLFAVLANVRNGYGFAGIVTGDPVLPIALPRGVPDDACEQYKAEAERWGQDGHSHSWLTRHDLLAYPWKSVRKQGLMLLSTYRRWKDAGGEGDPDEWCGEAVGPGIEKISENVALSLDMKALAALQKDDDGMGERIYVTASWSTSLRADCEEFLEVAIPRLQELEDECGEGNARLVFFFDN